jgi:multidrug efflux pump subunit AcrA (membrane-fusion protein)
MATNKIELKSEEVRELLKTPPSWLVRWGSLILLVVLFFMVLFSVFITFPKIEIIPLNLVRSQEIFPVLMPANGKIKYWFKNEGDSLIAGEPIALLTNQAEYIDVLALEERLARFQPEDPSSFKDFGDLSSLRLGSLAKDLEFFENAIQGEVHVSQPKQSKGFRARQIKALEQLIDQLVPEFSDLSESYRQQKETFKIAQDDYASGRLSEVRLREIGRGLDALEKKVANLEAEIKERKDSLAVIKKEVSRNPKQEVVFDTGLINAAFDSLRNSINKWKSGHLIFSGATGSLTNIKANKEELISGETIADIQVFKSQYLIAEAILDENQLKQVKEGKLFLKAGPNKEILLNNSDWILIKEEQSGKDKIQISFQKLENLTNQDLESYNPELKIEWGNESLFSRLWKDYAN